VLTLTRKVGETIRIGDDIEITVKEIRKNQVRIGIIAPREIKVFREELYERSPTKPGPEVRALPGEACPIRVEATRHGKTVVGARARCLHCNRTFHGPPGTEVELLEQLEATCPEKKR